MAGLLGMGGFGLGCAAFGDYVGDDGPDTGRIEIDRGDGHTFILGHCSAVLVSPGHVVREGQIVGRMGWTEGAHVHIEARVANLDVDYMIVDPNHALGHSGKPRPPKDDDNDCVGGGKGWDYPTGPVLTPNPWNGEIFNVDWFNVGRHQSLLHAAEREFGIRPRGLLGCVVMVETQGIHERDGVVLQIWDAWPQDGPSVGITQVKPKVHGWRLPGADAYSLEGNIRLGAKTLSDMIREEGGWRDAIANRYHPAPASHGTTPNKYVECLKGLLAEIRSERRGGHDRR